MTSTLFFPSVLGSRWFGGMLAAFCLCFLSNEAATATVPIYINNGNNSYFQPGPPQVPQIDATAFVNSNIFSVTYNTFPYNQITTCQPWFNTLFYTNTGELILNAPFASNGQFNTLTTGVAFNFDLQTETNSHLMAGTFYNPGTIHCNSELDGNNPDVFEIQLSAFGFTQFSTFGCCFVTATNIINPGIIRVSDDAELSLTGQNVDLSRANLTVERGFSTNISRNVDAIINSEAEGKNTNGYDPGAALTATSASSSLPDFLTLNSPTSYFATTQVGTSNVVVQAVFIVNANSNVTANVYLAPNNYGQDSAVVQWAGTYPDSLTGLPDTNYLYLLNLGPVTTNVTPIVTVGVVPPPGFFFAYNSIWQQSSPLSLPAPSTPSFQSFPFGNVTNLYAFFNATLAVNTNQSGQNPSGALTNLANNVVINASSELKMPLARITGPDYMSIMAPNQFDGSQGAVIATPFADVDLGVTNGFPHPLTVSNLLVAAVPQWTGTLDTWSGHWTGRDANSNFVDYIVTLVYSDVTPTMAPQVQNLTLTASNLVISDVLNVFGSAFANAQSLTLTTNNPGTGATSPDGELNLAMPPTGWTWSSTLPNLAWLTNDGAIRLPNNADFISSAPATNAVPTIPSIQATNILVENGGTNVARGSTVSVGGSTYTFTNTITTSKMTSATSVNVKVGTNFDASMSNLIAAINGNGAGTVYTTNGTLPNLAVTAGSLLTSVDGTTNHGFIVTANSIYSGTNALRGDFVSVSTTATNLTWALAEGVSLTGAVDAIPGTTNIVSSQAPYGAIINNSLISDQGSSLWVSNFMNGGIFTNGSGSFLLTSVTATMTNGFLFAGGDVSLTADTLEVSNLNLQAGRSLTLQVTNFLTDDGVSNGNLWVVGTANGTGFNGMGLVLPFLPANTTPGLNNLLGTTISMMTPPPNQRVSSTWAGLDYGTSTLGYTTNNVAVGQLILNSVAPGSDFYFTGPAGSISSNAIYVDQLVLSNYTSLAFSEGTRVLTNLDFAPTMTIYYADAVASSDLNGGPLEDVSDLINGFNSGRLQWVPQYVGQFSGENLTNLNGSVSRVNSALANDPNLDSNGSGIPNSENPQPFFQSYQLDFQQVRVSSSLEKITWNSVPSATNYVQYATTNWFDWNTYTNFVSPSSSSTWPITNIIYVPIPLNPATSNCWFRVRIDQNNAVYYGK